MEATYFNYNVDIFLVQFLNVLMVLNVVFISIFQFLMNLYFYELLRILTQLFFQCPESDHDDYGVCQFLDTRSLLNFPKLIQKNVGEALDDIKHAG